MFIFLLIITIISACITARNLYLLWNCDEFYKYLNPQGYNNGVRFVRKAIIATVFLVGLTIYFY